MRARFKLDENLSRDAEELLRAAGHEVMTALEHGLGGGNDSDLLAACRSENRILVTFDLDFADIRMYPPEAQAGIWILRPFTQSIGDALAVLRGAVDLLRTEPTEHRLWIAQPGRVRIRE